jgi:hypothetical protein
MILVAIVAQLAAAQLTLPSSRTTPASTQQSVMLAEDTPVELMATAEVSTADSAPGKLFKLRVNKPIFLDGRVVVPVGTPAFGQVVSAVDAGGLGKSGRMTARLLNMRVGDAEIPLTGEMSAKGTGAGSAGVAVLFTGAMGLFHRGNNAKIKAGEILMGYVAHDVSLNLPIAGAQTPPTSLGLAR